MKTVPLILSALLGLWGNNALLAATLQESIQTIRSVGPEGQGNSAASAAWQALAQAEIKSLPALLAGMDGANDLALNWLRAAVEAVAARAVSKGEALPVAALEKFVHEQNHHPRARRLAYDLIASANPKTAEQLMAKMLDDPSAELRRDSVQRLVDAADTMRKAGQTNAAISQYEAALKPARDVDQITTIAKSLGELKQPVDLRTTFGWVATWHVIGPFDNTAIAGYDKVYPPEEKLDLNAEYDGKLGKVRWNPITSTNDYGKVDLNEPLGNLKEVTGYAWTEFYSDKARPVELRLACKNGWKVWLNGKLLFGRNEYHLNTQIDHFKLAGDLKAGKNTILVKLCQNAEVQNWTKQWEFQMRVTDAIGTPIFSAKK